MCSYQLNPVRYCRHDIWVSSSCLGCLGDLTQQKSAISSRRKWEGFLGSSAVKNMPHLTNQFSVLENCTVGITSDMLHPPAPSGQTETKPTMSKTSPVIPTISETDLPPHVYVHSADLHWCTKVTLKICSVDTGIPLAIDSLLDSGATALFIDVEFVKEQKLWTHPLPHAIPVYNIDGTANEASSIKEEVDLICTFGNHMEHATFSVTSTYHHSWTHLACWA